LIAAGAAYRLSIDISGQRHVEIRGAARISRDFLQVSHTFCRDFINLLLRDDGASGQFGGTDVLVQGLRRVSHPSISK